MNDFLVVLPRLDREQLLEYLTRIEELKLAPSIRLSFYTTALLDGFDHPPRPRHGGLAGLVSARPAFRGQAFRHPIGNGALQELECRGSLLEATSGGR